jgi:4-hydroxybenzoate polyprenyltransferase
LLRLNKPTGIFLLFFPCAFATILFASKSSDLWLLCLFAIGSLIMRSSGCIINDIIDKDLDIKVARTKTRAIASSAISVQNALVILGILLLAGLWTLLQLPLLAIKIGLFSSPLIVIYPLCKRFSYFPQVILGLIFNIGALIAAATLQKAITMEALWLYLGCVFWTIGYDTVYGFMDIVDDKKIGIKSLAIKLEHRAYKLWLACFYSLFIACLLMCSLAVGKDFCWLLVLPWLALLLNIYMLEVSCPKAASNHFTNSQLIGLLICIYCLDLKNWFLIFSRIALLHE